jgi:hypothetical protein
MAYKINRSLLHFKMDARLSKHSQQFRNTPSLSRTASRRVRPFCVEDLRNLPESRVHDVFAKPGNYLVDASDPICINASISFDKWPDQPSPNGPLVIS